MKQVARVLSRSNSRRRSDELELVSNSGLFDPEWYLQAYPDVSRAKIDPLRHYMDLGWREGRNPGPDFATSAYLKANLDVALAGVNPLLHFIEFGHSEGRTSAAHRPLPRQSLAMPAEFGPTAPCASFAVPPYDPVPWKRAHALDPRPRLFSAGDCPVGYLPNATAGKMLESAFRLLQLLSGAAEGAAAQGAPELPPAAGGLVDGWFVNDRQLRIRWKAAHYPTVLRAYQHDPAGRTSLCMVGEGLSTSRVDPVDLHLRNRFFPVLLVSAAPDGTVLGATMLSFPSLCRGGAHYAELLYSSAADVDPLATGDLMASRLLRILSPLSNPAIGQIEVDISAADGRGGLFQKDLQLWLERVFDVAVTPVGERKGPGADFLAEAVVVQARGHRRGSGATLTIDHDMIPTIAALTEASEPAELDVEQFSAAVLFAGADPSQPAIEISPPRETMPSLDKWNAPSSPRWPRLRRHGGLKLPHAFPAAAIRFCAAGTIPDALLFEPVADLPTLEGRPPITWIVDTAAWQEGRLAQAVHALSLQCGAAGDWLCWLGQPEPVAKSVARERFAGRTKLSNEIKAAVDGCETPIVAFVAPNVLVHDRRCAEVLASLLEDELIATASCAIIDVKQAGPRLSAFMPQAGSFQTSSGASLGQMERNAVVATLWGRSYAIAFPGPHLWMARKSSLSEWFDESRRNFGSRFHICCSAVSASNLGGRSIQVPSFVRAAAAGRATEVRAFFG